jgi:hypothetical protein
MSSPKRAAAARHRPSGRTRGRGALLCVLAAIAAIAASGITWVLSPNWGQRAVTAQGRNVGEVPTAPGVLAAAFVSPNMIEIPKLNARSPIVDVYTLPGGELDVPKNPQVVGWWAPGAKPGARTGTAILAGHINYHGVAGSLARIGTLDPGDTVYVDGVHNGKRTRVKFAITGVRTYDKKALPYKEIFDQKSVGRLAIVTCGGPFDAQTGNYLQNIVAFAVPA